MNLPPAPDNRKRKLVITLVIAASVLFVGGLIAVAVGLNGTAPAPAPTPTKTVTPKPTETKIPKPTPTPIKAYPVSLLEQGVQVGAFAPPSPNLKDGMSSITQVESDLGSKMEYVNWFTKWADEYGQFTTSTDHTTTQAQLDQVSSGGRLPMITWEPWAHGDTADNSTYNMADVAAGKYDDYIHSWAKGMATFGKPVYIRFAHEMNGNWYPWSKGADTADYIAGWKHVHDIFVADGATNVKWIWAPAQKDFSAPLEQYYPGNDYVDILGTSLYNCHSDGWVSFTDSLQPVYDRLAALSADKPIWVTELGTCDPTEETVPNWNNEPRADWYTQIFNSTTFPRLQSIILFDAVGKDQWQIPAGSASANAFRNSYSQTKGWNAPPAGTTYGPSLLAPLHLTNTKTDPTVNLLSWDPVDNAQGYVIYRDGKIVAETLTPSWSEYDINQTTPRIYTVAPINGGTVGAPSNISTD